MTRGRSYQPSFGGTSEYKDSHKLDEAELQQLVQRLRDGDTSVREKIIASHYRLATYLARKMCTKARHDDLIGEALCALTQAVTWAGPHTDSDGVQHPSRLTDNDITPYISSTIRGALRDYISRDKNVFIPRRQLTELAKDGQLDPNGENDMVFAPAFKEEYQLEPSVESHLRLATYLVAREEEPPYEVLDCLDASIKTSQERMVINLRKEGMKYREIADRLGVGITRVNTLVDNVRERFDVLNACG